jgi:simple sugar transport system permease protein
MKLITEKRELATKWFRFFAPIVSILVALFVAGFLLLAAGVNPLQAYLEIIQEALGSLYGISETLVKTTPLIFASLGVSLAFRMQIWNIGAEGQIYMGAPFSAAGCGPASPACCEPAGRSTRSLSPC